MKGIFLDVESRFIEKSRCCLMSCVLLLLVVVVGCTSRRNESDPNKTVYSRRGEEERVPTPAS